MRRCRLNSGRFGGPQEEGSLGHRAQQEVNDRALDMVHLIRNIQAIDAVGIHLQVVLLLVDGHVVGSVEAVDTVAVYLLNGHVVLLIEGHVVGNLSDQWFTRFINKRQSIGHLVKSVKSLR